MRNTVVGVFDNAQAARTDVVNDLLQNGFRREDIHVEANTSTQDDWGRDYSQADAPDDEDKGTGIRHWFSSLFGNDEPAADAGHYHEAVRRGGTLVAVDADTDAQCDQAMTILEKHNAVDIHERAAQWEQEGWTGSLSAAPSQPRHGLHTPPGDPTLSQRAGSDQVVLPVTQEELQIGKREVEHGRVRVYSRVTEQPVEQQVQLRTEQVNVERRPVDRPVAAGDSDAFRSQTLEFTEKAEEAVVGKRAHVVEEVVIDKKAGERTETVHDTVRHTNVEVDRSNSGTVPPRTI